MKVLQMISDNILRNWGAYSAALGVLFVAVVSTAPIEPPTSFKDLWRWGREALQTAIPAARHPVIPQQAEDNIEEPEPKQ
jgi:hypothetical protein